MICPWLYVVAISGSNLWDVYSVACIWVEKETFNIFPVWERKWNFQRVSRKLQVSTCFLHYSGITSGIQVSHIQYIYYHPFVFLSLCASNFLQLVFKVIERKVDKPIQWHFTDISPRLGWSFSTISTGHWLFHTWKKSILYY